MGGSFARETVAKLELGPRVPYVAAPHTTHQPPLPRGPGLQNALAHAATQPQPRAPEAGWRHAAPTHGPSDDVSHPSTNRGCRLPPASNPGRASGRLAPGGRKWWGGGRVRRPQHSVALRHCVRVGFVVGREEPLLYLLFGESEPCSGPCCGPVLRRKPGKSSPPCSLSLPT